MMSEEDEKRARQDLENNLPYDYCRSCDSPDGLYHEWIDEDSWQYKIKMLLEEKDKEIDCQNKLSEKVERLNNIMDELAKDLAKWLNKIQELKGDDVDE